MRTIQPPAMSDLKLELDASGPVIGGVNPPADAIASLNAFQRVSFDAKALVSLEGYYQAQCPRHAELLGLRDDELLGRPLEFVIGAELARGVRAAAVSGQLFRGEGHVALKSGRNLVVGLGALRDGDHLVLALSDRTQATQLESRLVLADRLAAVGTVAAGVAHEINNPLAYILANLSYSLSELNGALGDSVAKGSPLGALLEEIVRALADAEEGAKRVRQIVRDLKTFSRGDQETTEVLDLRPILDSAINMAWSEIRHRAKLVRDFQEIPTVEASAGRLGQIFLNVLVNAAQAIPEGAPERNHISVTTRRGDGGQAVVEISDSGVGMTSAVRARIFDPFFTTKPVGVGTGLGLSITQRLVSSMGGSIDVDSSPGQGTRFRISFAPAIRRSEVPAPRKVA